MGEWARAGENLVRHRGGTYYLRAKVGGKVIRISLETRDLRIAKLKRDDQLESLRQAAAEERSREVLTLGDALLEAEGQAVGPHLKESTRLDYRQRFDALRKSLPTAKHGRRWTETEARDWWKSFGKGRSPHKANQALRFMRKAMAILIEHGIRTTDPTRNLRPMRVTEAERAMPSREEIEKIIENVRVQGKRCSTEASNYIAFLAFSGCRHGEVKALCWEHVGPEWLTVSGGAEGTKNRKVRQVPIVPPMAELLERLRWDGACGPIFHMKSPRFALTAACKRLGLPHLRLHDLHHWFGSYAIESGVDIPTVARWMGHQDGGARLMKTHAHLSDRHSLKQAKRFK